MERLKEVIRKVSFANNIPSVTEVLQGFVERSGEDIDDFKGSIDELILAQAVRVLRNKKTCITPVAMEEFNDLVELIKSLEEVKENDKDVLCRRSNPRK